MPISRRTLLKIISVSLIALGLYRLWGGKPDKFISNIFPVFLDTLLPRDETPSVTDLNIEKQFEE